MLCRGYKKCFWFCSETFCVRNKCFPVCAEWKHNIHFVSRAFALQGKIMSNNVSAAVCSRLPGGIRGEWEKANWYFRAPFFLDSSSLILFYFICFRITSSTLQLLIILNFYIAASINIKELKHATFLSHGRSPEVYCFSILLVFTLSHLYFSISLRL